MSLQNGQRFVCSIVTPTSTKLEPHPGHEAVSMPRYAKQFPHLLTCNIISSNMQMLYKNIANRKVGIDCKKKRDRKV